MQKSWDWCCDFGSLEKKPVLYQLYKFQCQKVTITHFIALFITPTHQVHFIAWWCHPPPNKEAINIYCHLFGIKTIEILNQ